MGGGKGGGDISSHTYFYYRVYFASRGIVREKPIYIYDATGSELFVLGPNEARVDYENGFWEVPGKTRNETVEKISTASFYVHYSSNKLDIDYNNLKFKIDKSLIPNINYAKVTADFEYATALAKIDSARNMFDGRWDTQAQVIFYAKPPSGYAFAILDLGQVYEIQAIDIIHGFFKPDERRSFDINNKYSLQYSIDGINSYPVCKEATNFNLSGGSSISFERDKLGDEFKARYFKLIINDMNKIEYGKGVWVASFVEFAAFQDVVLIGEAFLIPTTKLNGAISPGASTIIVDDTSAFSSSGTAYVEEDAFTYTSKSITSFLGCSGIDSSHADDVRISQELESDTKIFDDEGILPKLGDKVFKDTKLNEFLDTQIKIEKRAKDWILESYKEHSKCSVDTGYGPHYRVAQTVLLKDAINYVEKRYFIENLKGSDRGLSLTLARYPA